MNILFTEKDSWFNLLMPFIKSTSGLVFKEELKTCQASDAQKTINMCWTIHSWSYSLIGIITVLLHWLSFNISVLISLQLVISYISQSAFQHPLETRPCKLDGTCCFYSAVGYRSMCGKKERIVSTLKLCWSQEPIFKDRKRPFWAVCWRILHF